MLVQFFISLDFSLYAKKFNMVQRFLSDTLLIKNSGSMIGAK